MVIAKEEEEEGGGGGLGVQFSYVIILGGKVLIHHTFLKTPAHPWDVINDRPTFC